jgi:hypothetical protein
MEFQVREMSGGNMLKGCKKVVSEKKVSVFFLILTRKNNVGRLQKEA